jgi:hypothetical protein
MKIFEDPEMKNQIQSVNFGKVEAGTTKEVTVYLYNDSDGMLTNLLYSFPTLPISEVLKVEGPVTIQSKQAGKLSLTWKPSTNFRKALKVDIAIEGQEVYLAEHTVMIEKEVE